MPEEYRFTATVKRVQEAGGGSYIEFPYDVQACFGRAGRVKVVCYFDGERYRGSLVKMGTPRHVVGVRKDILERIGKKAGDEIAVRLSEDAEERTVELDPRLESVLAGDGGLKRGYENLPYTKKKAMNEALALAKKEETRARRLEAIVRSLRELGG